MFYVCFWRGTNSCSDDQIFENDVHDYHTYFEYQFNP